MSAVITVPVVDPDDERLADYRSLTELQLRSRLEPEKGLFIAEGELVIRRAIAAGYRLRSLLLDKQRVEQLADVIHGAGADVPVYVADRTVVEPLTGFHVHRGVLAAFHRRAPLAAAQLLAVAQRVLVVEDVNNHTNLGVVFRSAAALGMDGVMLSPSCVDPLYRRCVRVSMGEVFAVPYARLEPWPSGLKAVQNAGFSLIALTPAVDSIDVADIPARARRRPALLLGAEGPGLTDGALEAADYRARIPMYNGVDSLNVGVAAALACYEFSRPMRRVAPRPKTRG
ncbi:MAG TPA: RNA methyltransferase [Mycobacteriales bacterium]|nr:RNA methyltransferase [Mycobacteriales bacterium]